MIAFTSTTRAPTRAPRWAATLAASTVLDYLATVDFHLGDGSHEEPIMLTTDGDSNCRVAACETSAARAKDLLRQYAVLQQRIDARVVKVRHVPDAENPADFLTKWIAAPKFEASVAYATNSKNKINETPPELLEWARAAVLAAIETFKASRV